MGLEEALQFADQDGTAAGVAVTIRVSGGAHGLASAFSLTADTVAAEILLVGEDDPASEDDASVAAGSAGPPTLTYADGVDLGCT